MSDKDKAARPKKAVHCQKCGRFMFNIVVTAEQPVVGEFAQIRDFRCGGCGREAMVLLGVFDKDQRDSRERVSEKLMQQLAKELTA